MPSSALMAPITQRFVDAIKRYAERNGIDVVRFRRGERKDDGVDAPSLTASQCAKVELS